MTQVERLAAFVVRNSDEELSEGARAQLKIRILDALDCAIGALDGEPVRWVRLQTQEFGGAELCTLIGGGRTAPDRAAFYNSSLIRYLDFNDSYLARGETCHPSDNLGAVLAAAEYAGRNHHDVSGRRHDGMGWARLRHGDIRVALHACFLGPDHRGVGPACALALGSGVLGAKPRLGRWATRYPEAPLCPRGDHERGIRSHQARPGPVKPDRQGRADRADRESQDDGDRHPGRHPVRDAHRGGSPRAAGERGFA